jgi:hypothetical protein
MAENFQAIGIDFFQGSMETILEYRDVTGASYPICIDPPPEIYTDYNVEPPHWAAVIDTGGIIQYLGPAENLAEITKKIEELLITGIESDSKHSANFILTQNYPNPFNHKTAIGYSLPFTSEIELGVYDITGKHLVRLVNEQKNAGQHLVIWDAAGFPSGIYLYRLTAKNQRTGTLIQSGKMKLIK